MLTRMHDDVMAIHIWSPCLRRRHPHLISRRSQSLIPSTRRSFSLPRSRAEEQNDEERVDHNRRPQQHAAPLAADSDIGKVQCGERTVGQHSVKRLARRAVRPAGHPETDQTDARRSGSRHPLCRLSQRRAKAEPRSAGTPAGQSLWPPRLRQRWQEGFSFDNGCGIRMRDARSYQTTSRIAHPASLSHIRCLLSRHPNLASRVWYLAEGFNFNDRPPARLLTCCSSP